MAIDAAVTKNRLEAHTIPSSTGSFPEFLEAEVAREPVPLKLDKAKYNRIHPRFLRELPGLLVGTINPSV